MHDQPAVQHLPTSMTDGRRVFIAAILISIACVAASPVSADVFDDHTAYWLKRATADAKPQTSLAMRDSLSLKSIGRGIGSPCIVVHTDEDNWTKALVTWGFRKGTDGNRVPVVLIERFVNYRGDRQTLTTATGKDIMLFPGFGFNFDIGQVVPQGQGEDILCVEEGVLKPAEKAEFFVLDGPAIPEPDPTERPDPTSHTGVLPSDFAGSWKVRIDGRWEGVWELDVEERRIFGRFISDETKSVYEISGKIAALPHNAKLSIELANASQSIDAFLWTKDKSAMAGIMIMADRKLGFFATRIKPNSSQEVEPTE
ncbi:MAG: hypothetical protein HQ518_18845 [Rhodopirellula sp.]|nr:hypothetical protein [Rhodopirellula sp.]